MEAEEKQNQENFTMGSVASAERDSVDQEQSRKRYSLNRMLHRVVGLVSALLMLWIAGTGTMMQLIDLKAIYRHEPQTTPTELSMQEGMYGPGGYAVIQLSDFNAMAFPKGFDLNQAIGVVLQAAHTPQNQGGGAGSGPGGGELNPMAWAELRMIHGVPIGQVMLGTRLVAFNALTGQPVTPVPPVALPQGRGLPPSLRQKLKTLHRFWNRSDTPGVYFEFLSGLILMFLLLTGVVMYFRLLGMRVGQGSWQLLWLSGGGWWRGLHRVVSILAAAFILCIAFSGTWIGFESSVGPLRRAFAGTAPVPAAGPQRPVAQPAAGGGQPGQAAGGPAAGGAGGAGGGRGRRNPIDLIIPLRDAEVQDMTTTTLAAMQRASSLVTLIKAIRLRILRPGEAGRGDQQRRRRDQPIRLQRR
jgi:hypothetical protein